MQKKLFKDISLLGFGMLVLTICIGILFYMAVSSETCQGLKEKLSLIQLGIDGEGTDYLKKIQTDDHLMWIAEDGMVLYENFLPESEKGQEIFAIETGGGIHYSDSLKKKTFYYAQQLEDGSILQILSAKGLWETVFSPFVIFGLFLLLAGFLLFFFFASKLSKRVVQPIQQICLDYPGMKTEDLYPEFQPLYQMVREQNRLIQQQIQEMKQIKREFSTITGNMSEGFIVTDNQANIISYNDSALKLLDAAPDEDGRCALNQRKRFREVAGEALCGRRKEQLIEIQGRCCQFIATPVIQNGQVNGAVIVILDVTEKEQREHLRRDFTANVSHELKTPLTSISGFAEIIRDGLTEPEATKEFAGDIYNESQRLIALVNDIIRLSELDEGGMEQEKECVNLYQLASCVIEQLQNAAETSSIHFILEGEDVFVDGVIQILEEMIFNLCDNAIKYNRPGGQVKVSIRKRGEKSEISVEDTGIGIPRTLQNRVFERFYCVDKSRSRNVGGTGLGLSIVKHGAACHHAEIQLESEEGVGTKITILFP